jgi:protein-tyrosine phosphatase
MADYVPQTILFVCTGNIFRSLVAEWALRAQLGEDRRYLVGSAGIQAEPQTVHPVVRARLLRKGADPTGHVQRKVTGELLAKAGLIVAMGEDHRLHLARAFGRHAVLFNEAAGRSSQSILDLHEALPDWQQDVRSAQAYVESVVDDIWEATPALIARLPQFFP